MNSCCDHGGLLKVRARVRSILPSLVAPVLLNLRINGTTCRGCVVPDTPATNLGLAGVKILYRTKKGPVDKISITTQEMPSSSDRFSGRKRFNNRCSITPFDLLEALSVLKPTFLPEREDQLDVSVPISRESQTFAQDFATDSASRRSPAARSGREFERQGGQGAGGSYTIYAGRPSI